MGLTAVPVSVFLSEKAFLEAANGFVRAHDDKMVVVLECKCIRVE
jgi:hypothetical protein